MQQTPTHPFDAAAPTYDDTFTHHQLGLWLRDMVRLHLPFTASAHVLELGCGTGEDAVWMAAQGIHITATDASAEMLKITAYKAQSQGAAVNTRLLDMNSPNAHLFDTPFDGVFSNFGALNCVEDRAQLVEFLAQAVKPGGKVVLVVMSPVCLWEIGWHLAHGKPKTAFRRLQPGIPAHVGDGKTIPVWYPSPGRLRREFAPYFQHQRTIGIGTLLPPSYLDHLVERRTGTFKCLAWVDRTFGHVYPMTHISDHYLMILERHHA